MRILIVDDEFVTLTKMKLLLSKYGECDAATNGTQAFKLYEQSVSSSNPYDLITMDIEMPELNGLELLNMIRSMERNESLFPVRILMISASSTRENVISAIRKRTDLFLVKPVKKNVLESYMAELGFAKT